MRRLCRRHRALGFLLDRCNPDAKGREADDGEESDCKPSGPILFGEKQDEDEEEERNERDDPDPRLP